MEGQEEKKVRERDEIFTKSIRAGKRTYFFDVKATKGSEFYLTITESKKRFNRDGNFFFEKHKLFLYREDFEKFLEGLNEVVEYIKENDKNYVPRQPRENDYYSENQSDNNDIVEKDNGFQNSSSEPEQVDEFTNVEFEDLEDK
ncbi:MAG: PUR family DNA/RNA-binding protein [Bacteroidales bacterium]|nr:PUR family DNA/RNA-binding protein [Bacteroidales bacterium]